jgi:hypothetical protein
MIFLRGGCRFFGVLNLLNFGGPLSEEYNIRDKSEYVFRAPPRYLKRSIVIHPLSIQNFRTRNYSHSPEMCLACVML